MTDLGLVAAGFAVMPLAAILWYAAPGLPDRRDLVWGFLSGTIVFIGVAHAMAATLLDQASLSFVLGDAVSIFIALLGLGLGIGVAWAVFEGPLVRMEPERILWVAVAFLAVHSANDGFVLGEGFIGGVAPQYRIDDVAFAATVLHRFAEGSIVIVPALAARRRAASAFPLLLVALLAIPAAFVPGWMFDAYGGTETGAAFGTGVPLLGTSVEVGLALVLLVRGFLPYAVASGGSRWALAAAVGFVSLSFLHFLVE